MSPLDLSRLSRPDAVAALRSYGRRFRSVVLPTTDPETEERAYRVGPDGHAAIDHVVHVANAAVLLGQALRQVLVEREPVLHPAVTDPDQRDWSTPPGTTVADALDRLDDELATLADQVDAIQPPDWDRSAPVAGGGTVTAADVVREAVRSGADGLRRTTEVVDAVRQR
jgi:hypothetical protein